MYKGACMGMLRNRLMQCVVLIAMTTRGLIYGFSVSDVQNMIARYRQAEQQNNYQGQLDVLNEIQLVMQTSRVFPIFNELRRQFGPQYREFIKERIQSLHNEFTQRQLRDRPRYQEDQEPSSRVQELLRAERAQYAQRDALRTEEENALRSALLEQLAKSLAEDWNRQRQLEQQQSKHSSFVDQAAQAIQADDMQPLDRSQASQGNIPVSRQGSAGRTLAAGNIDKSELVGYAATATGPGILMPAGASGSAPEARRLIGVGPASLSSSPLSQDRVPNLVQPVVGKGKGSVPPPPPPGKGATALPPKNWKDANRVQAQREMDTLFTNEDMFRHMDPRADNDALREIFTFLFQSQQLKNPEFLNVLLFSNDQTYFTQAAFHNNLQLIKMIFEGARLADTGEYKNLPVKFNHFSLAVPNQEGLTPLMIAVEQEYFDVVYYLCQLALRNKQLGRINPPPQLPGDIFIPVGTNETLQSAFEIAQRKEQDAQDQSRKNIWRTIIFAINKVIEEGARPGTSIGASERTATLSGRYGGGTGERREVEIWNTRQGQQAIQNLNNSINQLVSSIESGISQWNQQDEYYAIVRRDLGYFNSLRDSIGEINKHYLSRLNNLETIAQLILEYVYAVQNLIHSHGNKQAVERARKALSENFESYNTMIARQS
jgi:hypothetical protein